MRGLGQKEGRVQLAITLQTLANGIILSLKRKRFRRRNRNKKIRKITLFNSDQSVCNLNIILVIINYIHNRNIKNILWKAYRKNKSNAFFKTLIDNRRTQKIRKTKITAIPILIEYLHSKKIKTCKNKNLTPTSLNHITNCRPYHFKVYKIVTLQ